MAQAAVSKTHKALGIRIHVLPWHKIMTVCVFCQQQAFQSSPVQLRLKILLKPGFEFVELAFFLREKNELKRPALTRTRILNLIFKAAASRSRSL
jgi:hypothetical protein